MCAQKKNKGSEDVARQNSLANLKKFTKETAKVNQLKSAAKRSENAIAKKAYKEVAEHYLKKLIGAGALDLLTDIEKFELIATKDQLAILDHLRDSSGQKPVNKVEQDLNVAPTPININFGGEDEAI